MKTLISKIAICSTVMGSLLATPAAHALIEVRAAIGINNIAPAELNTTGIAFNSLFGYGVDAIITPPLFPIGLGVRYETLSQKISVLGTDLKLAESRVALIVNSRLINTGIFLGPIATYGLSNTASLTAGTSEYTGGEMTSYSVGVEGGLTMIGWILGGEVGYQSFVAKSLSLNGSNYQYNGANAKADLSGLYLRVLIGMGF